LRQALRSGVAGYLTKHDSFGEIEKAVRAVHAGRQAFSPHVSARLVSTPLGLRVDSSGGEGLLATLTPREIEVLVCLARGASVKQCAELLSIATSTADNHKSSLMHKLGVHKSADLTRFALRHGLVTE
jgi:DNA-binding NarL/FixJ family response regulator